jgi:ABC-type nitrate/sulfonate/bicarbonate transport system, permease component
MSRRPRTVRWPWTVLALVIGLFAWEATVRLSGLPAFILPAPMRVGLRFVEALRDGSLLWHTAATLFETLAGLGLGLAAAVVLGYLISKSPALERALTPYLVASQAVPVVAIAPLLVIWLGPGVLSKILICALIVFFPILVNTGYRARIRNHGHSCFLCEIVIRSQFHTHTSRSIKCKAWGAYE